MKKQSSKVKEFLMYTKDKQINTLKQALTLIKQYKKQTNIKELTKIVFFLKEVSSITKEQFGKVLQELDIVQEIRQIFDFQKLRQDTQDLMQYTINFISNIAGQMSVSYLLKLNTLKEYFCFLRNHKNLKNQILLEIVYGLGNFAGDDLKVRQIIINEGNIVQPMIEIASKKMTIEFTI